MATKPDLNAPITLIGAPSVFNSFSDKDSGGRGNMYSSNLSQCVIVDGCTPPLTYTSLDDTLADFVFDASRRRDDVEVLAVIPRNCIGMSSSGSDPIKVNYQFMVIAVEINTRLLTYFQIDEHFVGSDGFGHENIINSRHFPHPGDIIPKDLALVRSPSQREDGTYAFGVDLNVAYMTHSDTVEDDIVMDQSIRGLFRSKEIKTKYIDVRSDTRPINLFGTDDMVKIVPDVGDYVGADGILYAARPIGGGVYVADLDASTLNRAYPYQDHIIRAPQGAKIVRLEFRVNPARAKELEATPHFNQIEKYRKSAVRYWETIYKTYLEYAPRYRCSPEFVDLADEACRNLIALGVTRIPGIQLSQRVDVTDHRGQIIEFMQIAITYVSDRDIIEASKVTDRHGGR